LKHEVRWESLGISPHGAHEDFGFDAIYRGEVGIEQDVVTS
jgi:hypothetical protein